MKWVSAQVPMEVWDRLDIEKGLSGSTMEETVRLALTQWAMWKEKSMDSRVRRREMAERQPALEL